MAGRKHFFFEKKNQKTFTPLGACRTLVVRNPTDKSFLVLFFKKELLPALLPRLASDGGGHYG
jgi:hypothetical protein